MTDVSLGEVNGHVTGRLLKETVRRAMVIIRNERTVFEAHTKMSYAGNMDDVFTSADKKAQEVYLRTFAECFPGCGVIGEEDDLRIEPAPGLDAYFTVDPLDGTKAYIRRQSHGVATMVALVVDGEVVSAYIGDTNADEIYGYRPDSDKVFRITRLDTFETLDLGESTPSEEAYVLLRDPEQKYSFATRAGILPHFKNQEVMGASIGTWMARLWKREVAAVVLTPGYETPWDSTPIIGISQKLGYLFFRPSEDGNRWEPFIPTLPKKVERRHHDVLVIHPRNAAELGLIPE